MPWWRTEPQGCISGAPLTGSGASSPKGSSHRPAGSLAVGALVEDGAIGEHLRRVPHRIWSIFTEGEPSPAHGKKPAAREEAGAASASSTSPAVHRSSRPCSRPHLASSRRSRAASVSATADVATDCPGSPLLYRLASGDGNTDAYADTSVLVLQASAACLMMTSTACSSRATSMATACSARWSSAFCVLMVHPPAQACLPHAMLDEISIRREKVEVRW